MHVRYTLSSETRIFLRKRLPVNLSNSPVKELFYGSFIVVSKEVFASFWIRGTRKSVGEYLYASPFFYFFFPKKISKEHIHGEFI